MLVVIFACLSLLGEIHGSSVSLQTRADPHFLPGTPLGHVNALEETSGLCASRVHPNILYAHNDKGFGPKLYAISALTGELKTTITVHGAHNYDWEDIACGPCDDNGGHCIYIGDIGDHAGDGAHNIIYKIREPITDMESVGHLTVNVDAVIRFVWNPPQQDSETLMVDPHRNLYIISKVPDGQGRVGVIENSAWNTSTITVVSNLITLPLSTGNQDPTGGDISPNGQEILIQTHHQIFYWRVVDGTSVEDTLRQSPIGVQYHYHKHGEAVAWDVRGSGYYTAPEGHHETLYYYARQ